MNKTILWMSEEMIKDFLFYSMIILLLTACGSTGSTLQRTPTAEFSQVAVITPTQTVVETIQNTLPVSTTPNSPSHTSNPTSSPSATLSSATAPIIHDSPGEVYETLFSIPVGERNIINYKIPSCCANVEGPNAIAVLPDDTFLISDPIGRQLLNYDQDGRLQQTIKLDEMGIGYVRDLRVKGNEIFLLETSYQKYRVHRLTLDGSLVASEEIPYDFPVDTKEKDYTLENALTGIAIDCEERIILEVTGGSRLFPLSEVQKQSDPSLITQGLLCNDERYYVTTPGQWGDPQVTAGKMNYQTKLTEGLGGLNFLDVFQDGSFYLTRDDVMPTTVIKVDRTVHFVDKNGTVNGVARVPLSEYYYPISRNTAISPIGEVFALLPRPNSLDVIRLNFYQELEPLIPGATDPIITTIN